MYNDRSSSLAAEILTGLAFVRFCCWFLRIHARRGQFGAAGSSATVLLQHGQRQANREAGQARRPEVSVTVLRGPCHVQQNGSVRDPFRRADQEQPFASVRPLDRVETQHRPVTGLCAAVLQGKQEDVTH